MAEEMSLQRKNELAQQQYAPPSLGQYLVCQKKRNNHRMNIQICAKKCDIKDECKEFQALHKGAER
jgi:hypothetical protein